MPSVSIENKLFPNNKIFKELIKLVNQYIYKRNLRKHESIEEETEHLIIIEESDSDEN